MNTELIQKVKEFVKENYAKACVKTKRGLKGHFEEVEKQAIKLCDRDKTVDKEIVMLAAWLHDIGTVMGDYENHHISGAKIAGEFLEKQDYPQDRIERVKHCILNHRGSKPGKAETKEAQTLINADAITHFRETELLIKEYGSGEKFLEKLERSYNKLSEEIKPLMKPELEELRKRFN